MSDEIVDVKARAAERIDAWVAALRSGKYKQGTMMLRDDADQYCCLGVLCEVVGLKWVLDSYIGPVTGTSYRTYPPRCVAASVGLINTSGHILSAPDEGPSLVTMNDENNKSFLEIADYIERNRARMIAAAK